MITQLLRWRVASDRAVIRFVQAVCFAAAAVIPAVAFRKFANWDLSEAQLLVGVAATMSMALFCTALGVLLELKAKTA